MPNHSLGSCLDREAEISLKSQELPSHKEKERKWPPGAQAHPTLSEWELTSATLLTLPNKFVLHCCSPTKLPYLGHYMDSFLISIRKVRATVCVHQQLKQGKVTQIEKSCV